MSEKFDEKDVQLSKYEKEYTESGFWEKISSVAKKAGIKVIYYALLLFFALQSDDVSLKERTIIVGALGYFIFPIDLIPDAIPVAGFIDDAAILLAVIKLLCCIDENVKAQAHQKLKDWFGNYDKKELE